jgi:uncharacterized protein
VSGDATPWITRHPDGVVLALRVQPGARRAGLAGVHGVDGEELSLRVTAPPVDGKANEAVLGTVATLLGVRRSSVELLSGTTARHKRVLVRGADEERIERRIRELLG